MHQCVYQQLAYYFLVVGRHAAAEHSLRHLVAFAKIRNLAPYGIRQLNRRQAAIVPHPLVDLLPLLVVFDRLNQRRSPQRPPIGRRAEEEHTETGERIALCQSIVGEQLIGTFLLDRILHSVGGGNALNEIGELSPIHGTTWHPTVHRLPRPARPLVGQAQHVVAQYRLASVANPQKIASVPRRRDTRRTVHHQFDELAPIGRMLQPR